MTAIHIMITLQQTRPVILLPKPSASSLTTLSIPASSLARPPTIAVPTATTGLAQRVVATALTIYTWAVAASSQVLATTLSTTGLASAVYHSSYLISAFLNPG